MYAIYYGIEWLVSWLRRPPLLWDFKDMLAIAIEAYCFYYIIKEIKRFIRKGRKTYEK